MTEAVSGAGNLDEETGGAGLLQRRQDFLLVAGAASQDEGGFEFQAHHRRHSQGAVGSLREAGEALADDAAHAFRDPELLHGGGCDPTPVPALDGA